MKNSIECEVINEGYEVTEVLLPAVSRTKSDELTKPMRMIDERIAKQDGPPECWDDDETVVIPWCENGGVVGCWCRACVGC